MEEIQNSAREVTANATARAQLITAKSQANYQVSQTQDSRPLDSKIVEVFVIYVKVSGYIKVLTSVV